MGDVLFFNLDLTVTEMEKSFDEVTKDTFEELGVEEIHPEEYFQIFLEYFENFSGDYREPRRKAFRDYFNRYNLEVDLEKAVKIYEKRELGAVNKPKDLRQKISKLKEEFKIGILTSGTTDLQRAKLEKLGIEEMIEAVVISYEFRKSKSNSLFKEAESTLDGDTFIYFSNHESDIEKAEKAGWKTVGLSLEKLGENPVEDIKEVIE